MRKVFSAANELVHANRLRARPVIRGSFFMFVLSRVVVGLARRRRAAGSRELRAARLTFFCTYKSMLDLYVHSVNWAKKEDFGDAGDVASRLAPTGDL
jgi:hypothetical protein